MGRKRPRPRRIPASKSPYRCSPGLTRQGIANGKPAVELAQKVRVVEADVDFEGFMAYSGGAAHTKGLGARRKKSADDLAGVRETVALAQKAGLP